ncbi:cytidylyltransferase domain-containing protein [Halomicroarcula sp. GCM10025817]|uniref:cytidylyltransferase domain-containing protein n=1 Tax=Haloarcula TaxID=2237 RepID=UPI0023E857B9|nr:NTP transferase domain-containing protein [Halomicroarcula sp. SYNS111]
MNVTVSTVISVQARMGSTRLPGKVLLDIGGARVLERVVNQCSTSDGPPVVVTTGNSPENEAVQEWCRRAAVECATGPENDLLSRHRTVADRTGADWLVRVTGDCPFVPSKEVERLLDEHGRTGARYTTNNTDAMPIGTAVDVFDRSLLAELDEAGADHPVKRPRANPDRWGTRFSPNPELEPYAGVHVAVDTPGDYWTLSDAVAAVGDGPRAVIEWVAENRSRREID